MTPSFVLSLIKLLIGLPRATEIEMSDDENRVSLDSSFGG